MNTALIEVHCDNNNLTSLNVSGNHALATLYCNNNDLTSLDVSGSSALIVIWCGNNLMDAAALNAFFRTLRTVTDPWPQIGGDIYCSENPGFTSNDLDVSIATSKNWSVDGL